MKIQFSSNESYEGYSFTNFYCSIDSELHFSVQVSTFYQILINVRALLWQDLNSFTHTRVNDPSTMKNYFSHSPHQHSQNNNKNPSNKLPIQSYYLQYQPACTQPRGTCHTDSRNTPRLQTPSHLDAPYNNRARTQMAHCGPSYMPRAKKSRAEQL